MTTIDKRVVQMAFDNDQFEKGVGTSLNTIKSLKKGLNFDDSTRSLSSLSRAAGSFSLNGIGQGVQEISNRFSALGVMGMGVILNLTNAAINFGKTVASTFFVDPVKLGFNEYELKMGAIQTIMAGTGEELQTVNKYLNDLNDYSDKTIYSFADMTQSIGKFTNAGVKLDLAVDSIKGIANVAALSGANSNEASRAMYNFSQALSQGSVRLIDWKSIELANMGTVGFKDQIIQTALELGTLTKAADGSIKTLKGTDVTAKNFQYTLDDLWFTSDVLTSTLTKYTDETTELGKSAINAAQDVKTFSQMISTLKETAQSGWAQTSELMLGDFKEGKALWTEMNGMLGGIISSSTDARNSLLEGWKQMGGRTMVIDALRNAFNNLMDIVKPITEAIREIFPPITSNQLYNFSVALRGLTEKFKMGSESLEKIKRIFKGVFAIVDIGRMAFLALVNVVGKLFNTLAPTAGSFVDILVNISDFVLGLRDSIKATDFFNKSIKKVHYFLLTVSDLLANTFTGLPEFVTGIADAFKGLFKSADLTNMTSLTEVMEKIKLRFEPLGKIGKLVGSIFDNLGKVFLVFTKLASKLFPVFLTLSTKASEGIGKFLDAMLKGFDNIDFNKMFDFINGSLLAALLLAMNKFVGKGSGLFGGILDIFKGLTGSLTGISGVLDSVRGTLEAYQTNLKAGTLLKIAGALALLTISLVALSLIDSRKLSFALSAVTVMIVQLFTAFAVMDNMTSVSGVLKNSGMVATIIGISTALLILAGAVSILGRMDTKELVNGILAVGSLTAILVTSSKTLSSSGPNMITAAAALIIFSFAIRSLTGAVEKLGAINQGSLIKGLLGVGALMVGLSLFMKFTDLSGMGALKGVGILILAGAVNILAIAVGKFAEMDTDKMTQGLIAVGVVLTELGLFVSLTGDGKRVISTSLGLAILAGAMYILALALGKMGEMPINEIGGALILMAASLAIITIAMKAMPKDMLLTATALVVVSGALVILASALTTLGSMTWEELAIGLAAMAGSLTILAVAMSAMTSTMPGAAALFVAAAALAVMVPPLKMMGEMSMQQIGQSLLMLAASLTVLGIAGAVMTPVVPTLLGLAAAIALLGIGIMLTGVGILALSAGLAALAISGAAGGAALTLVLTGLIGLIPVFAKKMVESIKIALTSFIDVIPLLMKVLKTMFMGFIPLIVEVIPAIVDAAMKFISAFLVTLAENLPSIIDSGWKMIVAFLTGIRDNIGEVAVLGYEIVINFLDAVAEKLPDMIDAGFKFIIAFIDGLAVAIEENIPRLMVSVNKLATAIVKGLLQGWIDMAANIREGVKDIGKIIIDGFKEALGIHSPSTVFVDLAKNIVLGLANGLRDYIYLAAESAVKLALAVLDAVKDVFDLNSPSKETTTMGRYVAEGLANGITKFAKKASDAAGDMAEKTVSSMSNVISRISDAIGSDMDVNPTIRPVMDMSDIMKGGKQLDRLMGDKKFSIATSLSSVPVISTDSSQNSQNGSETLKPTAGANVTFTQINNSPKELSRIDIYRQTKNQLRQLKGLGGAL